MPLATEKLNRRSSEGAIGKAISGAIATMMGEYERTGKIGRTKPRDKAHAQEIAVAIAHEDARRHAGEKAGRRES